MWDIFAVAISGIALVLSVLSYFGSIQTRRREWRIEAGRAAQETGYALRKALLRILESREPWQAILFMDHGRESGAHIQKMAEIDTKTSDARALMNTLESLTKNLAKCNDAELEHVLVQLRSLQVEAEGLTAWADTQDEERRQRAARRRELQGKPPSLHGGGQ